jgi:hypothetical protein
MKNLSVVVVNWNARRFLARCISSLIQGSQGLRSEVLLVDNASSDGSVEFVRRRFPEVKIIESAHNLGFAQGCNLGIRESSGRYLLLVNPDVVALQGCVETLVETLDRHPEVGLVGPRIVGVDGCVQPSCMRFPSLWSAGCRAFALDTLFKRLTTLSSSAARGRKMSTSRDVDVVNGCFWAVRRQAIDEVGLLDERFFMYSEDVDWCRRFGEHGWLVRYQPQAQAIHFGGGSSAAAPVRFYVEMRRAEIQYWEKHRGRQSTLAFTLIMAVHQVLRFLAASMACLFARSPARRAHSMRENSRLALKWLYRRGNATGESVLIEQLAPPRRNTVLGQTAP